MTIANSTKLRQLIAQHQFLRMPCVYDGLTAQLAQKAGFLALATSGNAISASLLGAPDLGLLSMSENLQHTGRLIQALNVPLICDVDTGYGGAMNTVRTVREFEAAGAAGIYLEDQVFPPRCGALPQDIAVISMSEQCRKLEVAAKSKVNQDFMLIARTDAKSMHGLREAALRAKAYLNAGADAAMIIGADTPEELTLVADIVQGPLVCVIQEHPPSVDLEDSLLLQLGCIVAMHSGAARYAVTKKLSEVFATMRLDSSTRGLKQDMCSQAEYNQALAIDDWLKLDN